MADGITARKNPCPTCPYRKNVASGIWDAEEYDKLTRYDGDIAEQVYAGGNRLFHCHSTPEDLCAGWVGHRDEPTDLLAVRLGITNGQVDISVASYSTEVPLFETGAEAAEHGKREIREPGARAQSNIEKILRTRSGR